MDISIDQALDRWEWELRAERKSERTIETYLHAASQLRQWLADAGHSLKVGEITKTDLTRFITHFIETRSPMTARQRFGSLRVFFGWLADEGVFADTENPIARLKAPKADEKPVAIIEDRTFQVLVETCKGEGGFVGNRDRAIFYTLWDCGLRLAEITALMVYDIDWSQGLIRVHKGKGGRYREVPFTREGGSALKAYQEWFRPSHSHAASDRLWLGERGPLGPRGISQMVGRRAERLGLPHIHVHAFRHTLTDRILTHGMTESDTMAIMGWSDASRNMLNRYGKVRAAERARESYRKLIG